MTRSSGGEAVKKKHLAEELDVSEKTIQRYVGEIRDYLKNIDPGNQLEYDPKSRDFKLMRGGNQALSDHDIFAVCKVMLDARAFCKEEMKLILDHLLCLSYNRDAIEQAIANERINYRPVKHKEKLIEKIWFFNQCIQNHQVLDVQYQKQDGTIKSYLINPLGLLFNEYYFYVIAEKNGVENPVSQVFRLDRFLNYAGVDGHHFHVEYSERFKEGEFRERIQFMYTGTLTDIWFKFSGPSLEAVLDRLPTATVVSTKNGVSTIKASVYGEGVKKWLLSQGDWVEVLRPKSYRQEMIAMIERMRGMYGEEDA